MLRVRLLLASLLISSSGWAQPLPENPDPPEQPPPDADDVGAEEPSDPVEPPVEPESVPSEPAPPPVESQPEPPPQYPPPDTGYAPMEPMPPPPEPRDEEGSSMPPWSVRIDPFNLLLEGRMGLELEVGVLKFMTVELTPVFVVSKKPPTLHLSGAPDVLRQESNGLGPISGASLDVGFWLNGTPLRGYVIRAGITNSGYKYTTEDDLGTIDEVDATERELYFLFGSHMRFGAFTIAGGIGLGYSLNNESRCFPRTATSVADATSDGCDDELQIATTRDAQEVVDLNGSLYPVSLIGRFSLGVAFD